MRGPTTWTKALAAAVAAALAWGAQAAPGNGIRLGGSDARLHPFVDLESRYDSNVSYTASNQAVGDLVVHLRPGLELKAPGELTAFEFSGAIDWAQYLGVERSDTTSLSRLYANASLAAVFNRGGAVAPRIDNTFTRQISTTSLSAASTAVISNQNTLSLSVPWKPGGGALVVAANARWMLESYERYRSVDGPSLTELGYNQYRGGAELQWRFLPRTTGLLEAGYTGRVPNTGRGPGAAKGYDVAAGLTGLLTARTSATLKAGYASTKVEEGAGLQGGTTPSFLADVELEWLPLDTLSLRAGYSRSLGIDPTVAAYKDDAVSGAVRLRLAERFALRVGGQWTHLAFSTVGGTTTDYLRVDPTVEGQLGRWLNVSTGYAYSQRTTGATGSYRPPSYGKHEAFVKVGVTY